MCGIYSYLGQDEAKEKILEGLKRLEYRGYDSCGIALISDDQLKLEKEIGEIDNLKPDSEFSGQIGIGHTRWATHGGVTKINAHPHLSADGTFAIAQNGIVENYQELREMLTNKGHEFQTETDTEVILRLIEEKAKNSEDLETAFRDAFLELDGRNTVILLSLEDNSVMAIRNGSPLVVGVNGKKDEKYSETFIASDVLSFLNKTNKVIYLDDFQIVKAAENEIKITDIKTDEDIDYKVVEVDIEDPKVEKEGYDHFMIKEIVEQSQTVKNVVQYSEEELSELIEAIKKARNIYTVAAGTAGLAAGQTAFFLRKFANVNAMEIKAYEYESFAPLFTADDLVISVSQSGETADTIEPLELAKSKGAKIASLVNMVGSTITRMSDYKFLSRTGPEISVASTKAFTAQISWGLLVAMTTVGRYQEAVDAVSKLSSIMESYLDEKLFSSIKELAKTLVGQEHIFILGKGQNYHIALEGALKNKEITYKHFEGFPAGELKHGTIALIEEGTPVFVVISNDENREYMINVASEVKARGARVIAVAKETNEVFDDVILAPDAGIIDSAINVVPFQLLSYYLGLELGNNIDKPRNLAKSVTVK